MADLSTRELFIDSIIQASQDVPGSAWSERDVLRCLDDPRWEERDRFYDWRNYVHDDVIAAWEGLARETKLAVLLCAVTCTKLERD